MSQRRPIAIVWLLFFLVLPPTNGRAQTPGERSFLSLYFSDEELGILSATRSLKSMASVAENVVVVTAEDIELMNAHTVAEALYNVTGVEVADFKGPGSEGLVSIHGSGSDRVAVLLDGVPLTTANNSFQLATLPVQMVQKIEVLKGPASSTWGSSFGGVVNVITKSAASGDRAGGTLAASVGERQTSDVRAELRAGTDRFGAYLFAGRMDSDGLRDGHEFAHENVFGKASFAAGPKTRIDLAGFLHRSDSVNADFRAFGRDEYNAFSLDALYGKADLQTSLVTDIDLRLSAWWLRNEDNFYSARLETDARLVDAPIRYDRHGFSGNLVWRAGSHVVTGGADASDESFERTLESFASIGRRKYALFVNDTVTFDGLGVTPGVRYDHSSLAGGLVSPSLGATWLVSRNLLFRALASRGFHDPAIVRHLDAPVRGYRASPDLAPEKIWSYQAGLEANVADLLRAKLTLFYHDIDAILINTVLGPGAFTTENLGRATTAGGEFEVETNTFHGFALSAGVHYELLKRLDFSDDLFFDRREIYGANAALEYRGKQGVRGTAKARYLWWDMTERWRAESRGVVVDLDLTRRFPAGGATALDVFVGAHNVFDAESYNDVLQQNPGRWLEAGVRCAF